MRVPPRKGFTLIELLIVITIIAMLAAMFIPLGGRIRELAKRAQCQMRLKGLRNAYISYVNTLNQGQFLPMWSPGEYQNNQYASWYYPQNNYQIIVNTRFDVNFGPLVWHRLVPDSDAFICPLIADSGFEWWHDNPVPGGEDTYWTSGFHNPDAVAVWQQYNLSGRIDARYTRSSYSIRPYLYPWTGSQLAAQGIRAVMADTCSVPICVLERHVTGVNVAFLDGSVEFVEDQILWDNRMSWNYVPKCPIMKRVWRTLEGRQ